MKTRLAFILVLLVVALVGCGDSESTGDNTEAEQLKERIASLEKELEAKQKPEPKPEPKPDARRGLPEEEAIAALEKLGAKIGRDDDGNVFVVVLTDTHITDADLRHVKELKSLQVLQLRNTITDAGLEHLKEKRKLKQLWLVRTEITDSGLESLKGLTNLEELALAGNNITDAGLVHLKGLTKLEFLSLHETQVTNAGVAELQLRVIDRECVGWRVVIFQKMRYSRGRRPWFESCIAH
jgi:hypothetical protein